MMNKLFLYLVMVLTLSTPAFLFAEDAPQTAASLTADIVIGTGIENREPTGVSDTFPTEVEQLVGWSRITGAQEPTEVRHVWKRNGQEMSSVPLNVQSTSFRTYSRKTIAGQTGTWTLEVRDVEGRVIASKEVQVTPAASQ